MNAKTLYLFMSKSISAKRNINSDLKIEELNPVIIISDVLYPPIYTYKIIANFKFKNYEINKFLQLISKNLPISSWGITNFIINKKKYSNIPYHYNLKLKKIYGI